MHFKNVKNDKYLCDYFSNVQLNITLKNSTIRCKKLTITVSSLKSLARPFLKTVKHSFLPINTYSRYFPKRYSTILQKACLWSAFLVFEECLKYDILCCQMQSAHKNLITQLNLNLRMTTEKNFEHYEKKMPLNLLLIYKGFPVILNEYN